MSLSNPDSGFDPEGAPQEVQETEAGVEVPAESPEMQELTNAENKLKSIYEAATESLSREELQEKYPELTNLDTEGAQEAGLELDKLVDPNGRSIEMLGAELEIISDVLHELNPELFDSLASRLKEREDVEALPSLNRMIREQLNAAKRGWARDENNNALPMFDMQSAISRMSGEQALKMADRLSGQLDTFLEAKKKNMELSQRFRTLDQNTNFQDKPEILRNENTDGLAARATSQEQQGDKLIVDVLRPLQETLDNYKKIVIAKEEARASAEQGAAA